MTTKTVDSKGRITLGTKLSGRVVQVDDSNPNRIVITPAVVIPEHEAWLYKNPKALKAVRQGLKQARAREVRQESPGPETVIHEIVEVLNHTNNTCSPFAG